MQAALSLYCWSSLRVEIGLNVEEATRCGSDEIEAGEMFRRLRMEASIMWMWGWTVAVAVPIVVAATARQRVTVAAGEVA